jgi:hypothetical protein
VTFVADKPNVVLDDVLATARLLAADVDAA